MGLSIHPGGMGLLVHSVVMVLVVHPVVMVLVVHPVQMVQVVHLVRQEAPLSLIQSVVIGIHQNEFSFHEVLVVEVLSRLADVLPACLGDTTLQENARSVAVLFRSDPVSKLVSALMCKSHPLSLLP
jgi:hypothetical protein